MADDVIKTWSTFERLLHVLVGAVHHGECVADITCNIDSFLQSVLRKFKPLLDRVLVERITAANVSYAINVVIFDHHNCAMCNNPSVLGKSVCVRLALVCTIVSN